MKKVLLIVSILVLFSSCNRDVLIEITYTNGKVDTVMYNTNHFVLDDGELIAIRNSASGGNVTVANNVKWYRKIK